MEELEENHEIYTNNRRPGRSSNRALPENESTAKVLFQQTRQACTVRTVCSEMLQTFINCRQGTWVLDSFCLKPHSSTQECRQMNWLMTEQGTQFIMLLIYISTRDAILASIHRNQGAVAALLTDIKQQPDDVTPETTPLHDTRYAPDHSASGKNRWIKGKRAWNISESGSLT